MLIHIINIVHINSYYTDRMLTITRFIRVIPADMCNRVIGKLAVRLNECLNRRGAHIEHILQMLKLVQLVMKSQMDKVEDDK